MRDYQSSGEVLKPNRNHKRANALLELNEVLNVLGEDIMGVDKEPDRVQVKYLIDIFYRIQGQRKVLQLQAGALDKNGTPVLLLDKFQKAYGYIEGQVTSIIDAISETSVAARWAKAQIGIGPLIAGSLMGYVDLEKARNVPQLWRFCGLDPSCKWLGRDKAHKLMKELDVSSNGLTPEVLATISERTGMAPKWVLDRAMSSGKIDVTLLEKSLAQPHYSHFMKQVAYYIGDSIIKTQNKPGSFYGPLFLERKAQEIMRNRRGDNAVTAERTLDEKRYGKTTAAYKAYRQGLLPDGQINARARRWVEKLFLSHWHMVASWEATGRRPNDPFVIASDKFQDHSRLILPPDYPDALRVLLGNQPKTVALAI